MRNGVAFLLLCGLLAGCSVGPGTQKPGREVRVAAAADLQFAFHELAAAFQKQNPGIKVTPTYGSSGNFFAQLSNDAPFDLFLSADTDYPRKLVEQGKAVKGSEFVYAVGHLVVWVPASSKLDVAKLGMRALTDPAAKKVAIANPKHAPYGRAAEAAMKKLGVYDEVKDRLVLGENVAQAAQFAESGAADVGVIALSLALAPTMRDKGRYAEVPLDAYPRLAQGGVLLSWAKDREAAEALRDFLTSAEGRAILNQYGFLPPGG
jgi:molybdate transport system substrate-binding protein